MFIRDFCLLLYVYMCFAILKGTTHHFSRQRKECKFFEIRRAGVIKERKRKEKIKNKTIEKRSLKRLQECKLYVQLKCLVVVIFLLPQQTQQRAKPRKNYLYFQSYVFFSFFFFLLFLFLFFCRLCYFQLIWRYHITFKFSFLFGFDHKAYEHLLCEKNFTLLLYLYR